MPQKEKEKQNAKTSTKEEIKVPAIQNKVNSQ